MRGQSRTLHQRAFTIVELVVVISVVGILAAITIVSYGAWQKSVRGSAVKNDLVAASAAMENNRNFGTSYVTTQSALDGIFTPSNDVSVALSLGEADTYCLDGQSTVDTSIVFYLYSKKKEDGPQPGTCLTRPDLEPPSAPSSVAFVSKTYQSISLSWPATADAESYIMQCASDPAFIYNQKQASIPLATPTVNGVVTGLSETSSFYCRVKAVNNKGVSVWSTMVTADTIANGWLQLAAGTGIHTCANSLTGQAYCWGSNSSGQLGVNSTVNSSVPVAVNTSGVLSGKTIKAISVSGNSTCAIASDDNAYCWGSNANGRLGNGSTVNSSVPVAVNTSGVLSGKTIKAISVGSSSACVIASDDKAYCWGYNDYGSLGNNTLVSSSVPVAVNTSGVLSGKTIKSIVTGSMSACVIASDDKAYCWGFNEYGKLGNNSTATSSVPVAVNTSGVLSGKTIKSLSTGNGSQHCAVTSEDKAYCWGWNGYGQLGNNSTTNSSVPVAVNTSGYLSDKTIKSISSGDATTCALASDNQVYCWGSNALGELGNGAATTMTSSPIPVPVLTNGVLSGKTVKALSAGFFGACVIASDDKAYCWGGNSAGRLGNNSTTNAYAPIRTLDPSL